jgi:hypothetical protein
MLDDRFAALDHPPGGRAMRAEVEIELKNLPRPMFEEMSGSVEEASAKE